jgi:hypothetical protein
MSRAINFTLPQDEVLAACEKFSVTVSAIEALPSGGTHLVCVREEGADEMRLRLKTHILAGVVRRFPFYRARGPW